MQGLSSRISLLSLLFVLVGGGAAACGDDDASSDGTDDGSTDGSGDDGSDDGGGSLADAGVPGSDAGPAEGDAAPAPPDTSPPAVSRVWVHGGFAGNARVQVGAYQIGTPTPATPSVLLPPGDTATLATLQSVNAGSYDISRNGQLIAFPADIEDQGRYDLHVARLDGSNLTRVVAVAPTARVGKARFSPDGRRIAFTADIETMGTFGAYVVPADAVDATPVLVSPAGASDDVDDLVWSADSNSLLITGDFTQAEFFELMVVDLTAPQPTSVTLVGRDQILATTTPAGAIQPILARNGRVLFKGRLDADNAVKLYIVDMDGQNLAVLPMSQIRRTDGLTSAEVGSVGLSPDGNLLAFGADETIGVYDLWVVPTSGNAPPIRLTTGLVPPPGGGTINPEFARPLVWRPDGQEIAFVADYVTLNKNEPFVAPIDGSGQRRVGNIAPTDPGGDRDAEAVGWSSDGSQLFVVADHAVRDRIELFVLDPTLADAELALVFAMPESGDLRGDITTSLSN